MSRNLPKPMHPESVVPTDEGNKWMSELDRLTRLFMKYSIERGGNLHQCTMARQSADQWKEKADQVLKEIVALMRQRCGIPFLIGLERELSVSVEKEIGSDAWSDADEETSWELATRDQPGSDPREWNKEEKPHDD